MRIRKDIGDDSRTKRKCAKKYWNEDVDNGRRTMCRHYWGGCIEAAIVSKALLILRGCAKAPQIVHVDMTGEDAEEEGMVCGGKVKVLLEEV